MIVRIDYAKHVDCVAQLDTEDLGSKFVEWMAESGIDPKNLTPAHVMNYLENGDSDDWVRNLRDSGEDGVEYELIDVVSA